METAILQAIKKYIKDMSDSNALTNIRKTAFADGYLAGLDAIQNIINIGEAIQNASNHLAHQRQ